MRNASLLKKAGLRAKKSFGQNFLEDQAILLRIAALSTAAPVHAVVEIGAGLGALTQALAAAGAPVMAVERDRDLAPLLRKRFSGTPNVDVLEANALTLDWAALRARHGLLNVCGNLPYHLTSPLLFGLLVQRQHWQRLVVMVQKEVALRMTAPPGNRTFGLLTVLLGGALHAQRAFDVPPGAFHPPPKVDSSVVVLTPRPQPVPGALLPQYAAVARAAFHGRRKTLRNTLKPLGLDVAALLTGAGVDGGLRAETLSLEDFGRLAQVAATLGLGEAPPLPGSPALE